MTTTPHRFPPTRAVRQQGLSLVELMVGIAVGMIVTLAVLASLGTLSLQRNNTVSGSQAKESGQFALSALERAGRLAGTGLFYNGQMLCPSFNAYYNGTVLSNGATLAPLRIVDGGATGSDTISLAYASPVGGSGLVHVVDAMPTSSSNFVVNHQGSLAVGDLAIVGVPGSTRPCTLFQVTAFPPGGGTCNGITTDCIKVQHNSGASGLYNPPNPDTAWTDAPRYGHETSGSIVGPAVISRLGTFTHETYEVLCNALVSHGTAVTPSCTSQTSFTGATPLAGNIVMLQAQYGITDTTDSDVVTSWVDATGSTWADPSAADIPRIKAMRVVVISRSTESSASNVSGPCTNDAGVVNTGPCSFQDAESPVIDLSSTSVPSGKSWRNYRYRVYSSIIPLRNVLWAY